MCCCRHDGIEERRLLLPQVHCCPVLGNVDPWARNNHFAAPQVEQLFGKVLRDHATVNDIVDRSKQVFGAAAARWSRSVTWRLGADHVRPAMRECRCRSRRAAMSLRSQWRRLVCTVTPLGLFVHRLVIAVARRRLVRALDKRLHLLDLFLEFRHPHVCPLPLPSLDGWREDANPASFGASLAHARAGIRVGQASNF